MVRLGVSAGLGWPHNETRKRERERPADPAALLLHPDMALPSFSLSNDVKVRSLEVC